MKYSPEIYAKILLQILGEAEGRKQQDEIVQRFIKTVQKNGDWTRINKILEAVEQKLVEKSGGRIIDVEFAREVGDFLRDKVKNYFSKKDKINIKINPALVAGVRITFDGDKELDYSFQKKLRKIFNY